MQEEHVKASPTRFKTFLNVKLVFLQQLQTHTNTIKINRRVVLVTYPGNAVIYITTDWLVSG